MISQRAIHKTDTGTIVLHWMLAITLMVLLATGLRIAADAAENNWLLAFDSVLPARMVWTAHIPAGIVLFALALAYAFYIGRAGLWRRIQPDRARLAGLFSFRRRGFLRALNVLLYWALFAILLMQLITGALLYFGYGAEIVSLHLFATWIILAFIVVHIVIHFAIGGIGQVLRIVQPTRLLPAAPKFDPLDLWASMSDPAHGDENMISPEQTASAEGRARIRAFPPAHVLHGRRDMPHGRRRVRRRDTTLQAHPLAVAVGVALTATGLLLAVERQTRDSLDIRLIAPADRPVLDGDIADSVWRDAPAVTVATDQGANFDGKGTTTVQIRAVHDREYVYFAFVWDDPTRSLKHLPLVKSKQGWRLLQEKYARDDEDTYFEDKFAVLLSSSDDVIPGDRTFHSGRAPLAGMPASSSGRGLHYTTGNEIADVWEWKATSSGESGAADDDYFGPPVEPTQAQEHGQQPYKGGFAGDPGSAAYADNFERRRAGGYDRPLRPLRLPKDWTKLRDAFGAIDLNPNHGESDNARWWMSENEFAALLGRTRRANSHRRDHSRRNRRRQIHRRSRRCAGGRPLVSRPMDA